MSESYPNKCAVCGGEFRQGRFVSKNVDGGLVHPECLAHIPTPSEIRMRGYEVHIRGERYFAPDWRDR